MRKTSQHHREANQEALKLHLSSPINHFHNPCQVINSLRQLTHRTQTRISEKKYKKNLINTWYIKKIYVTTCNSYFQIKNNGMLLP